MPKQEEIEKGIHNIVGDCLIKIGCGAGGCPKAEILEEEAQETCVQSLIEYLRSKGAMLKVECPDCTWSQFSGSEVVAMTPCYRCNSTGYIEEPLIKEEHHG